MNKEINMTQKPPQFTQNSLLANEAHEDHALWRLIKAWELLLESHTLCAHDLGDIEIDNLTKLERTIADYTPQSVEGLKLKSQMVRYDYLDSMCCPQESDALTTDCLLALSIFKHIEGLEEPARVNNRSPKEALFILEPYICDLARLTSLVLDANEADKNPADKSAMIATLAEKKAEELLQVYYQVLNTQSEKADGSVVKMQKAAS